MLRAMATQASFGKGRPPSQRPSKVCAACGLPFTWRRKWARDWEQVKYCSDRCRKQAKSRPA
ncbi:DUF2256 domain-containing protein [Deinococcus multiflagellatus]|uniref:DUF2256 domain-containing protein n=1 Tax=Deinococcus multiflagellatus TaxID=1656887 RepID=UPI0029622EAE|nr:DUF2256 domain-containing protein [Deinococcus multiflagellatus]